MSDRYDIILCGPVTGIPDYVARFAVAYCAARQEALYATGKLPRVWNPAELPPGRENIWYMQLCTAVIFSSPRAKVIMLPGWRESLGGLAEYHLANCLGLEIGGAV